MPEQPPEREPITIQTCVMADVVIEQIGSNEYDVKGSPEGHPFARLNRVSLERLGLPVPVAAPPKDCRYVNDSTGRLWLRKELDPFYWTDGLDLTVDLITLVKTYGPLFKPSLPPEPTPPAKVKKKAAPKKQEPEGLPQPLLTMEDLSAYLGVPMATLRRWRNTHTGPVGMKLGRHVRYRMEDVTTWLDNKTKETS